MAREFNLRIQKIKGIVDPVKMANDAYLIFYKNTPVRSGNARRNTNLKRDEIQANYPYATRLDEGYSKQSPKGMTDPTIKWLKEYVKKNLGK